MVICRLIAVTLFCCSCFCVKAGLRPGLQPMIELPSGGSFYSTGDLHQESTMLRTLIFTEVVRQRLAQCTLSRDGNTLFFDVGGVTKQIVNATLGWHGNT